MQDKGSLAAEVSGLSPYGSGCSDLASITEPYLMIRTEKMKILAPRITSYIHIHLRIHVLCSTESHAEVSIVAPEVIGCRNYSSVASLRRLVASFEDYQRKTPVDLI